MQLAETEVVLCNFIAELESMRLADTEHLDIGSQ
jgi:hypothetical protein